MPETSFKFQVLCYTEADKFYQANNPFDTLHEAEQYARTRKLDVDAVYKIIQIITTKAVAKVFTVPAYVPVPMTWEEMLDYTIGASDGCYNLEFPDDYDKLSKEKKAEFIDEVHKHVDACGHCGWYFSVENLEDCNGETVCYSCASTVQEEEENE